jgi:thiol-disulfide isomerase/thioredoxin
MRQFAIRRRLFAAALALTFGLAPAWGQGADALLRDFTATGEYRFVLDGKALPKAEIYRSVRAAAVLVIASELESPVLISPGLRTVETVNLMKVMKQPDGTVDLLADAALARQGGLAVRDGEVSFTVQGKSAKLVDNPPLLKWRTSGELFEHDFGYTRRAQSYTPERAALDALKAAAPARVVVFFGSWCPHCSEYLPRLLRVQQELAGAGVQFEYYGLPQGAAMTADPEARKAKISFVPQAVVYRGGAEIGRLEGGDWATPERSLRILLASS